MFTCGTIWLLTHGQVTLAEPGLRTLEFLAPQRPPAIQSADSKGQAQKQQHTGLSYLGGPQPSGSLAFQAF